MEYTLKFNFTTLKVSRGGNIEGSNGAGECDITSQSYSK